MSGAAGCVFGRSPLGVAPEAGFSVDCAPVKNLLLLVVLALPLDGGAADRSRIRGEIQSLCVQILAYGNAIRPEAEIASLYEQTLFNEIPIFQAPFPHFEAFRAIAIDEAKALVSQERMGTLLAQHSIANIAERRWHEKMTPEEFRAVIARSRRDSQPFRKHSGQRAVEVPWAEVAFPVKDPLLKTTVETFLASRLPIYAISPQLALNTQVEYNTENVAQAVETGVLAHYRQVFDNGQIADALCSSLTRWGAYAPDGEPPGIYMANYFVLADPQEYLLHQMVLVSQDRTWDLMHLLEHYHQTIRPGLSGDQIGLTPGQLRQMQEMRRRAFLLASGDRPYRETVLARGESYGFTPKEWVVFFDLFTVVYQFDAHRQAAQLLWERNIPSRELGTEARILQYVLAVYQIQQGTITGLVNQARPTWVTVGRLADHLNQHRRH